MGREARSRAFCILRTVEKFLSPPLCFARSPEPSPGQPQRCGQAYFGSRPDAPVLPRGFVGQPVLPLEMPSPLRSAPARLQSTLLLPLPVLFMVAPSFPWFLIELHYHGRRYWSGGRF